MPRPGPRPYECVRRAWHSDRHQPIRGSLIQEIFRVVNEIHSPATRKNKEWQDKLPIVVLKAEEIMYSKANSEAEYMDLKTLWDRANDAINTIIRLDESTETGVYLQPCIEAALNLGCTPRRTSRSQRNNTSSCYLNVNGGETTCSPSNNLQRTTQEAPIAINPLISHYSKITNPNSISPLQFRLKYHTPLVLPSDNWIGRDKFSFSLPSIPLSDNGKFLSVYPLYYGNDLRSNNSKTSGEDTKREIAKADLRSTRESSPGVECDLSLRLGPCTGSSSTTKTSGYHDNECFSFRTSQTSKDVSFLPNNTTVHNSLNSALDKWISESGKMNVDGALRKRKAVVSDISEDRPSHWQPNISSNYYGGRMRNAGS